jgi:hypothetical protein
VDSPAQTAFKVEPCSQRPTLSNSTQPQGLQPMRRLVDTLCPSTRDSTARSVGLASSGSRPRLLPDSILLALPPQKTRSDVLMPQALTGLQVGLCRSLPSELAINLKRGVSPTQHHLVPST